MRLTDNTEVLVQTVSDKHAAKIDKQSQLFVRHLRRHERMRRSLDIQVPGWTRDKDDQKRCIREHLVITYV